MSDYIAQNTIGLIIYSYRDPSTESMLAKRALVGETLSAVYKNSES